MAIQIFDFRDDYKRLRKKNVYFQYSTSEQFTGEYWIDGKKIYQKTFTTTKNNINTGNTNINVSNLGSYRAWVPQGCFVVFSGGVNQYPLLNLGVINNAGYCNGAYNSEEGTVYLTVRYTKTTD
ncbi:hypothetical protein B5E92_04435 [Erysipelatoclostridium sp. An15]|nr:hypothetical protein B5E92_04435 [Erysipelatoclostridium sp. An15]